MFIYRLCENLSITITPSNALYKRRGKSKHDSKDCEYTDAFTGLSNYLILSEEDANWAFLHLNTSSFLEYLKSSRTGVKLLAVLESHLCIQKVHVLALQEECQECTQQIPVEKLHETMPPLPL